MAKRRHSAHHDTGDGGDHPSGLGLFGRLRAYFLAGFLLTAPISITLYIGWILVSFIDGEVQALIPERFNPETYLPFSVPGIGVIILVVALTVLGAFAAGVIGRMITGMSEAALSRIPAVRSIYGAV